MKTEDIILIALIALSLYVLIHSGLGILKNRREYKELRRQLSRSEEVEVFRNKIAGLYGDKGLQALPSFESMCEDTKELTTTNYLDLSKVINQN